MNIKIKDLPKEERPRERLINKGAASLSDSELLTIILKTGTKEMSAKRLSELLLKNIGNIKNIKNINYQELTKIKGIGKAKACLILAISELTKRITIEQDKIIDVKITSAKTVYEYYKYIVDSYQEGFYCLYLDSSKTVLSEKKLFVGTVNKSMVHPRDVFKEAYKVNATAFICIHNHPNGIPKPSSDDIITTNRLNEIGTLAGIKLIDHVIIGENSYYSFLENGKL